nr:hypothetical protein CFP56_21919 [Quercus suber]
MIVSPANMHINTVVSLLLAFWSSLALAIETERSVDIFAWPLTAPKAQSLAKVTYNSTTATVHSYNTPKILAGDDIVRIGFYHKSGSWSGIATSASNFDESKDKKLQLLLNGNGEIYHVGFRAEDFPTSSKSSNKKDGLSVELVQTMPGPVPVLNKPVVLSADGKSEQKEPEKTFLQK